MNPMKIRSRTLVALVIASCLAIPFAVESAPLSGEKPTLSATNHHMFVPGQVIIQFAPGITELGKSEARALVGAHRLMSDSTEQGDLELASLPVGANPKRASAMLESHPAVHFAEVNAFYDDVSRDTNANRELDAPVRASDHEGGESELALRPNDPLFPLQWGMGAASDLNGAGIRMPEAWHLTAGVASNGPAWVAVLDSGIWVNHPDLRGRIINPGEDANGDGQATADDRNDVDDDGNGAVDDIHGWNFRISGPHVELSPSEFGSHVSGIAAAVTHDLMGVAGVGGPDGRVRIIGCVVKQDYGVAHGYHVARGHPLRGRSQEPRRPHRGHQRLIRLDGAQHGARGCDPARR